MSFYNFFFSFLCSSSLLIYSFSFFAEVLRIGTPGYLPNETDVLRARQKSVGITETRFSMGELSYVPLSCRFSLSFINSLIEYTCSMLEGSAPSARSGYTASRALPRSSSARRSASTTRCCWRRNLRYGALFFHTLCSYSSLHPRTEWQNPLSYLSLSSTRGGSYALPSSSS